MNKKRILMVLIVLGILFPLAILLHLFCGQTSLTIADYFPSDLNQLTTKQLLAREFRIPRMVMAVIAGSGLSLAGMLMQTMFKNPLAGPYVLGINSGASLLVAISLMTGMEFFGTEFGLIGSGLIGALLSGLLMMAIAHRMKSQISLLLIGLMFGSFTSAIVSIIESFAKAEQLKAYTMWNMGSLQQVEFSQLNVILGVFILGICVSFLLVKSLNMLVIGEHSAGLLGLKVIQTRFLIMAITALFAGVITAFCGPIAFVGLAVPNLTRILFRTQNHSWLILGNLLIGAIFLLLCDSIIQMFEGQIALPINALTSLIGSPFVVFLLMRKIR
jgi:iron complex transport system permease protein